MNNNTRGSYMRKYDRRISQMELLILDHCAFLENPQPVARKIV